MYNPTRKVSLYGGQRFVLELPCGHCAECREMRRTEIYFRTYYECLRVWNTSGYVYFDTLTYDNYNLPHISDFYSKIVRGSSRDYSCFNADDVKAFLMRLRRHLEYRGHNVRKHLKYFISSEYGSEQYTARPHYHILFFIDGESNISPINLSHAVNECWQKGRTDGIDYHDYNYVRQHIYGPGYNDDEVHMRAVCNYVAKYVLKDNKFENTLNGRIKSVTNDAYLESPAGQKRFKKLMKHMRPYCRWSHGYGEYGLEYNERDLMVNENKMRIPDKNKVWRYAPLSGYLSRKLFYATKLDEHGHVYWYRTDLGKEKAFERAVRGAEQFADRFREWLMNLDLLMKKGDQKDVYDESKDEWHLEDVTTKDILDYRRDLIEKVIAYLDGRTPEDFAVYVQFFKGRVKTLDMMYDKERRGYSRIPSVKLFFMNGILNKDELESVSEGLYLYNYGHYTDRRHYQQYFLCSEDRRCKVEVGKRKNGKPIYQNGFYADSFDYGYERMIDKYYGNYVDKYNKYRTGKCMSSKNFCEEYVIDENTNPIWHDFDKLYRLYSSSLRFYNDRKQDTYDYVEDMKRRLKDKGFFIKSL